MELLLARVTSQQEKEPVPHSNWNRIWIGTRLSLVDNQSLWFLKFEFHDIREVRFDQWVDSCRWGQSSIWYHTLLVFVTNPVLDDFYLSTYVMFIVIRCMIMVKLREHIPSDCLLKLTMFFYRKLTFVIQRHLFRIV